MLVCKHSDFVKETLADIVRGMADSSMLYVKNPEKDFSRNRKLSFETVVNLLISMGGNTLYKECVVHSKNRPKFTLLTIEKSTTVFLSYTEKPTIS